MAERAFPVPLATYRLQFDARFRFDDAAALAPYLAKLGVSHVYASPFLKARPGSTHGYDIVDHAALNPELGDAEAFKRMTSAFAAHRLGLILDFVPNHMGVGGSDNPFWLNVLEWGAGSAYAGWFDIDWAPDEAYLRDKVLVPFLGAQYGAELQAGQLRLRYGEDGGFAVWAYDTHELPVHPLDYGVILGDAHPELERFADAFASLATWRPQIERRARELKDGLARRAREDESVAAAIRTATARFDGTIGDLESWRRLDGLIARQFWRVADFRVAADDINYRRFFNINDLAGIRMELPDVFEHAHRFVFELLASGRLDGLRIDHVDGLLDPLGYLQRLRDAMPAPHYLVVEKILARHEQLRAEWPVDGTTGYDFTNLVLGLLIDPASEAAFTAVYEQFTGERTSFEEIVRRSKLRIMENEMASELNVLARDAARIARQHPRSADFTHHILHRALKELVAAFPVYRTYIDGSPPAEADRRDIDWAVAQARRRAEVDSSVFDFVHALVTADLVAEPRSGYSRESVVRFAMRLQQYSGPVMAKGLEDTAFYRYQRFVALNEVGGVPDAFGITAAAFHRANERRASDWPHAMLATSTHDTKRGEDARARLAALSEVPNEWNQNVTAWSRILRARRADIEAAAPPSRNDEYLLYQTMLASWPDGAFDSRRLDATTLGAFGERLKASMIKSIREAKVRSTWAAPDEAYESGVTAFIDDALNLGQSPAFIHMFLPFAERIARAGVHNALVQTALKLTVPGVPDIYQGSELWNTSMVDPDNRRAVDYAAREQAIANVDDRLQRDREGTLRGLLAEPWDGAIKLALTRILLALRAAHPRIFTDGDYSEAIVEGEHSPLVCAFERHAGDERIVVAVLRFPARRAALATLDAALVMPAALDERPLTECLTGRRIAGVRRLDAAALFGVLPVAVLAPDPA